MKKIPIFISMFMLYAGTAHANADNYEIESLEPENNVLSQIHSENREVFALENDEVEFNSPLQRSKRSELPIVQQGASYFVARGFNLDKSSFLSRRCLQGVGYSSVNNYGTTAHASIVSSMSELNQFYKSTTSYGAKASFLGIGAELNHSKTSVKSHDFSDNSTMVAIAIQQRIRVIHMDFVDDGDELMFTANAQNMLDGDEVEKFRNECGHGYAQSVYIGKTLYIILKVYGNSTKNSKEVAKEIKGSVSGWGQSISGGYSKNSKFSTLLKQNTVDYFSHVLGDSSTYYVNSEATLASEMRRFTEPKSGDGFVLGISFSAYPKHPKLPEIELGVFNPSSLSKSSYFKQVKQKRIKSVCRYLGWGALFPDGCSEMYLERVTVWNGKEIAKTFQLSPLNDYMYHPLSSNFKNTIYDTYTNHNGIKTYTEYWAIYRKKLH